MKTSASRTATGKTAANPASSGPAMTDNRATAVQQRKMQEAIASSPRQQAQQLKANKTGLPDQLKAGVENLSGHSLDDVQVHYNSAKPADLQAHAYAQGTDIHLAPGQEQHLPHEAWHVVQQKQGRVKPTTQLKGQHPINDDAGLEAEADAMGTKAAQRMPAPARPVQQMKAAASAAVVQRMPNPKSHIGPDIVNVGFGMNHPADTPNFSLYNAHKKAAARGGKNTIIKITGPELKTELEHLIGQVTQDEFDKATKPIVKPTAGEYFWITSNADGSGQKAGKQAIDLGLNRRGGAMTNQMWIAHLESAKLAHDQALLDRIEMKTRVADHNLRTEDEQVAAGERALAEYHAAQAKAPPEKEPDSDTDD
ncbi:hypothetical protein GCM10022409_48070 [Hymenobacter glaciei]|uniref:eCIS core domain-containing protein n=1 Tax=Hymenobacter glaciei TaxID=877209 RepID=A0ABP7UXX8_9BACT